MSELVKMILKLAVLIIPALILYSILYLGPKGNGIGGGSYDLSEMVYGGLFMLFVLCWDIWMLVCLLTAKTPASILNHKILLGIGVVVLISVAIWFLKLLY